MIKTTSQLDEYRCALINHPLYNALNSIDAIQRFMETHVFAVSTTRREWVRTPLGGFINHSEEPNCYISTDTEERILHSVRPIKAGEELTVYYRFESYDGMTA